MRLSRAIDVKFFAIFLPISAPPGVFSARKPGGVSAGNRRPDQAFYWKTTVRFDFAYDTLIAGDVGQKQVEEVDQVVKDGNYGWHYKEGSFRFDSSTGNVYADRVTPPAGVTLIDPIGPARV